MILTRATAEDLLSEYVTDDYQKLHAHMVASVMEAYAQKYGDDRDLWYITGLVHDLDFDQFPHEHPYKELAWFKEWALPEELVHAVDAHAHSITGTQPKADLAKVLLAVDELTGFLYAYSLMRPEGFKGMKASSAAKKFKDRSFAAKIDRTEVSYGVTQLGIDFSEHLAFVITVLETFTNA